MSWEMPNFRQTGKVLKLKIPHTHPQPHPVPGKLGLLVTHLWLLFNKPGYLEEMITIQVPKFSMEEEL